MVAGLRAPARWRRCSLGVLLRVTSSCTHPAKRGASRESPLDSRRQAKAPCVPWSCLRAVKVDTRGFGPRAQSSRRREDLGISRRDSCGTLTTLHSTPLHTAHLGGSLITFPGSMRTFPRPAESGGLGAMQVPLCCQHHSDSSGRLPIDYRK